MSGDTNAKEDIFLVTLGWSQDYLTNITISGDADSNAPSVSCNGNSISYQSVATNLVSGDTNSSRDVFAYDRLSQTQVRASVDSSESQVSTASEWPSISDDGRFVVFQSDSLNLDSVAGNPNGGNIFIRDMKSGTTQAVSRNANYVVGNSSVPSVSADGSYVAYINIESGSSPYGKLLTTDTNTRADAYTSETGF